MEVDFGKLDLIMNRENKIRYIIKPIFDLRLAYFPFRCYHFSRKSGNRVLLVHVLLNSAIRLSGRLPESSFDAVSRF
jgi:hypothetical protein